MAELNPSYNQELCYTAQNDRLMLANLVCVEGVADVAGGDLEVTTGGSGLNVSVAQGGAFVEGDDDDRGVYSVYNDAAKTLTATAANGTNPRIDTVVARVYDTTYGEGQDAWHLEILAGTATAGASLSNLTGAASLVGINAIPLAYVLVPATFTGPFVDATHILDARAPYETCGGKTELFDGSNGTGGTFSGTAPIVAVTVPARPYRRAVQLHGACLFLGTSTANTIDSTIVRDVGSFAFVQEKIRVTEVVTGAGDFSVPVSGIDYLDVDEEVTYTYQSTVSGGGNATTAADAAFVRMQASVTPA